MMKTRRSLLITSVVTIIFENMKLLTNKLAIFGVEVEISQRDLVRIGQAAIVYLMIIFAMQAAPSLFKVIGWLRGKKLNKAERLGWKKFHEEWDFGDANYDDDRYSGGPTGESEQLKAEFDGKRKQLTDWTTKMTSGSIILAHVVVVYFVPVIIGLIGICYPLSISYLIS
jgi:hypothetical protein